MNSLNVDRYVDSRKERIEDAMVDQARTWQLIANKAHLYSTAYCLETGEYIAILGVRRVGVFACQLRDGTEKDFGCEMLHDYRV